MSFHQSLWARSDCHRAGASGKVDPLSKLPFVKGGYHGTVPIEDHLLKDLGPIGEMLTDQFCVFVNCAEAVLQTVLPAEVDALKVVHNSMGAVANVPAGFCSLLIMVFHLQTGVHIDADDYANVLTGLMIVGEFKGGDLVFLKLQIVPKRDPGVMVFFKSGDLLHLNRTSVSLLHWANESSQHSNCCMPCFRVSSLVILHLAGCQLARL